MRRQKKSLYKVFIQTPLLKALPFIVYIVSITAAFRFEMFIQSVDVNSHFLNPFVYLFDCIINDGAVLLIISPVFIAAARYLNKRGFYLVTASITLLYLHILIFFSGYYLIFESSFVTAAVGSGLTTYWYEILTSMLHEIRFRSYAESASGIILLALLSYSVKCRPVKFRYIAALLPMVLFIPFFIFGVVSSLYCEEKPYQDYSNIIRNPLLVLTDFTRSIPAPEEKVTDTDKPLVFSTDSLVDNSILPAIPVERKKYNIIFYFAESTYAAYTDLKINGREVTPTWNRLSRNSIKFSRHYVQYPLSVNALFNVLSSAYTPLGKKWIPMSHPDLKIKSASELLKQNGYRTALFHTSRLTEFNHIDYLKHRRYDLIMDMADMPRGRYTKTYSGALDDRTMIKPSIDFMKKSTQPFFVSYFPVAPHHPYYSLHPELNIYSQEEIKNDSNVKSRLMKSYINSLRSADECISELVARLEENNLLDNTLIFIFADHGEAFYQHRGNYLHALYLYEENLHVPFIIFSKKLFSKEIKYDGISRHIDIVPTMLDFIGIKPESEYEGISLLRPHREQLAYSYTDWNHEYSSVRDGEWKYILRNDNRCEELYNIKSDPDEKNNVASSNSELLALFRKYVKNARSHQVYFFEKKYSD